MQGQWCSCQYARSRHMMRLEKVLLSFLPPAMKRLQCSAKASHLWSRLQTHVFVGFGMLHRIFWREGRTARPRTQDLRLALR